MLTVERYLIRHKILAPELVFVMYISLKYFLIVCEGLFWGYFISFSALRAIRPLTFPHLNAARNISCTSFGKRCFSVSGSTPTPLSSKSLLSNKELLQISSNITPVPVRTVTKFSLNKGKRKTVKNVVKRFFRLHWGGWIRPKVGRQKRLWKKSAAQRRRLKQHVFCNGTQSTLLDKMVTKFWKRPKYYVDDPYAPYHKREEFHITRRKPVQPNWK